MLTVYCSNVQTVISCDSDITQSDLGGGGGGGGLNKWLLVYSFALCI